MSLLAGVVRITVLGDMETRPRLPFPPAAVGVGVTTWAVFVGPSTVLMYVLVVKVEVSVLVDVGTSPGVLCYFLWSVQTSALVLSVCFHVQVYTQSMPISTTSIHSTVRCYHNALDWNQLTLSFCVIRFWTRTWCTS